MKIRKIAVLGSFAAGAALALAPLAAADDLTPTIDSEIGSLNSIFVTDADLAGVGSDVVTNGTNTFDTIPLADVNTTLGYELYGLNPANAVSDPGSYSVFNGALTEFYDADNALTYGLLNNDALIPSTDLFGSATEIGTALGTGSDLGAAGDFFSAGLADLAGLL
ncbi:MAG: hypothetical protein JO045_01345 [Mycobacterium sp.]|nr:hypothetical protein [Mycobacterium sp.]